MVSHEILTRLVPPLRAEFSFETNAPPVGGYLVSDRLAVTAGVERVVLQSTAWTDDFEDLPVKYEFGYTNGWLDVFSVSR